MRLRHPTMRRSHTLSAAVVPATLRYSSVPRGNPWLRMPPRSAPALAGLPAPLDLLRHTDPQLGYEGLGGVPGLALAAVGHVAEELGVPRAIGPVAAAVVAHANEPPVGARGVLVDPANAGPASGAPALGLHLAAAVGGC